MDIRNNLKIAYQFFPLKSLIKITSEKIFLPFYHTVSDEKLPHISNLYTLRSQKQFEKDIDYLCRYFKPVSINELQSIIHSGRNVEKPCFHLSFDDGLKEVYTIIAQILEKKGVPATVFVNTAFLDNKSLFYRYKVSLILEKIKWASYDSIRLLKLLGISDESTTSIRNKLLALKYNQKDIIDAIAKLLDIDVKEYLNSEQPYLTTYQLKELQRKGFEIGAHSVDHPFFKDIDYKEQKRQIHESFKTLKNLFNTDNNFFSFPFSDESVTASLFNWMYEKENCKLSFGISGLKKDHFAYHLHRIPFEESNMDAKDVVKSEYFYYIIKWLFNKNKIIRQ